MNRFLRMSLCVAVVLALGTALTLVAAIAPTLVYALAGTGDPPILPAALNAPLITLLAWFGIQFSAGLGEWLALRLGLQPRGRDPAPGLLRSSLAFGAGVVSGAVVLVPPLTMFGGTPGWVVWLAMGASGTVGFLWARAVLRGGLFAPPPADPPA